MNPMLRPELGLRSGDGSRQNGSDNLCATNKNQNKQVFRVDTKEEGREKEESKFVTLLIFHTLQIGVLHWG